MATRKVRRSSAGDSLLILTLILLVGGSVLVTAAGQASGPSSLVLAALTTTANATLVAGEVRLPTTTPSPPPSPTPRPTLPPTLTPVAPLVTATVPMPTATRTIAASPTLVANPTLVASSDPTFNQAVALLLSTQPVAVQQDAATRQLFATGLSNLSHRCTAPDALTIAKLAVAARSKLQQAGASGKLSLILNGTALTGPVTSCQLAFDRYVATQLGRPVRNE